MPVESVGQNHKQRGFDTGHFGQFVIGRMGQPLGEMGGVVCQIFVWLRFGEYDVVVMLQPIIGAMRPELFGFQVINAILKAD
ncbi:hypothetical [Yersinia pestis KIM10+]|uniref:Uncharacterized protein n=1 Tax=Yersinia pestis TaxID=632 RepID=Q8CKM8_YERPE|nr:hypothetical [Yersinia pestis KIM10+]EIR29445.1 hypothetical protein YPPY12_4302 [Yersinia pestis PY-12]